MSELYEKSLMELYLDGIEFDPVRVAQGFTVGGNLYITVGERCFPEQGWYDCVSELLVQWLPALISFAHCSTDSCLLRFMDGPAAVRLNRQDGRVAVDCIWNKHVQISEDGIDFYSFADSVVKAAHKYCRLVHQSGGTVCNTEIIADYGKKLDKEIGDAT